VYLECGSEGRGYWEQERVYGYLIAPVVRASGGLTVIFFFLASLPIELRYDIVKGRFRLENDTLQGRGFRQAVPNAIHWELLPLLGIE